MTGGALNLTVIELLRDHLDKGEDFSLNVAASSMYPALRPGDTIRVSKCELPDLTCGDLVVFEKRGLLCTHRFLSFREGYISTKADRSLHADEPVLENDFLGRVTSARRGSRSIDFESRHWRYINLILGMISIAAAGLYSMLRGIKRGFR